MLLRLGALIRAQCLRRAHDPLRRARRHHQFLLPARGLASPGRWWRAPTSSASPPSASPTATPSPAWCARMTRRRSAKIKLLVGTRLVTTDGFEVIAYPTDRAAYGRLCRLLTRGQPQGQEGRMPSRLRRHPGGDRGPDARSLCRQKSLRRASPNGSPRSRARRRDALFSPASIAIAATSRAASGRLDELGTSVGAPLVAVNDVLYHAPERRPLADVIDLHPREMHHSRSRPAARGQCRAPSQIPERDGAAVRRLPGRDRAQPEDRRRLRVLARRAQIRISRRAGAAGQDAAAASRGSDLGGRARALPAGQISGRHSRCTSAAGSRRSSPSSPSSITRATSSPSTTSSSSRAAARRRFSARAAARPPTARSAIASASPRSIPTRASCCSPASSRKTATSRPTSTSISSTSGARRSSSTSTSATAASAPRSARPSSITARAAPSARSARRWGSPPT